MADLFSTQLDECSWRGVSFPIEMVGEKGGQRLAIHHKMDRDGAQVESTGRLPLSFTVKAYFLEGLTPGQNESWADLYPQGWLQMRDYLMKKSTGIFVHPLYGEINCKPVAWNVAFTSEIRSGVIVDMEFMETIDDTDVGVVLAPTVISGVTSAALNLDTQMLNPVTKPPFVPNMGGFPSYSSAVSDILSIGQLQGVNKIDNLTNELFSFGDSLNIADDLVAAFSDVTYDFIDALNTLKLQFQFSQKDTAIYTVGFDTTLASIAGFVGNSITQIIELNPFLLAEPIIPRDTEVAYYSL